MVEINLHCSHIPKVTAPNVVKEFRPISSCNMSYKIITKLLVHRLKALLPRLISAEQGAFVSGQVISDNVLATQEILHSMGSRKEEGECVLLSS